MTAPETTVLNTAEMQAALRIAGLPPGPASPFASLTPPASISQAVASALFQKHVVNGNGGMTDAWRQALTVLTSPAHKVAVFLGSPERWFSMDYYVADDAMIGCTVDDSGYHITFPVNRENVAVAASEWLRLSAAPSRHAPHIDMDADEITVFAAAVDAAREESIRALIERRLPDLSRFTRDQLAAEVEWASQPDGRWLCSVLQRHAPSVFAPAGGGLGMGAKKLAARGWLRLAEDDTTIEGELQSMSVKMMNLNPYVTLDARTTGGLASVVIVMTGISSFWAIELFGGAEGRPMARLFEMGGPEATQLFARYLAHLPAPVQWALPPTVPIVQPAPAPSSAPAWTPPPSAPLAPPVMSVGPPAAPACPRCGKALQPGRLFCTGCGTKVVG